jgi:hypothetical protein
LRAYLTNFSSVLIPVSVTYGADHGSGGRSEEDEDGGRIIFRPSRGASWRERLWQLAFGIARKANQEQEHGRDANLEFGVQTDHYEMPSLLKNGFNEVNQI